MLAKSPRTPLGQRQINPTPLFYVVILIRSPWTGFGFGFWFIFFFFIPFCKRTKLDQIRGFSALSFLSLYLIRKAEEKVSRTRERGPLPSSKASFWERFLTNQNESQKETRQIADSPPLRKRERETEL